MGIAVAHIRDIMPNCGVVERDVNEVPSVDEPWVAANFTPADQRSQAQKAVLRLSDILISELQQADIIIIGTPIYNFTLPSTLKAYFDHVARSGITFAGGKGLLKNKRAIVCVASGGIAQGSSNDLLTPYLKQILGFIGITSIDFVSARTVAKPRGEEVESASKAIRS